MTTEPRAQQCKDIPDRPILEFLVGLKNATGYMYSGFDNSVLRAMPSGEETPINLASAKMASMIKRELVFGCTCGCRGDFEITPKGLQFLAEAPWSES